MAVFFVAVLDKPTFVLPFAVCFFICNFAIRFGARRNARAYKVNIWNTIQ